MRSTHTAVTGFVRCILFIMDQHVIWAIIFLGMALVVFLVELFVPTGGILAVVSTVCAITGVVFLFWVDTTVGLIGALVVLIAAPVLIGFAMRIWPHTPLGRAMTLSAEQVPVTRAAKPEYAGTPEPEDARVGQRGTTATDLRPVGACIINGQRIECISARGIIPRGTAVVIVDVDGLAIRVEPADDEA